MNPSTLNTFTSCLSSAACSLCWAQPCFTQQEKNKTKQAFVFQFPHARRSGEGADDAAESSAPSREPTQADVGPAD